MNMTLDTSTRRLSAALALKKRQTAKMRQCGFTMVSAIFLLVALAVLGAAMVSISTTQSTNFAQDLQGSRAYHAARAGVEWGIYRVMDTTNTTVVAPTSGTWPNFVNCATATASMVIEGFNVTVQCARCPGDATLCPSATAVYNEAGNARSIAVYRITSTASAGTVGAVNYVERQLAATVSKCRSTEGVLPDYACP